MQRHFFRQSTRTLRIRDKLVLYALIMVIPVLIFSFIYLKESQRILQSKAGTLISESLGLSLSWIDELLNGAVRISAAIEADSLINDFLLAHKETSIQNENALKIRNVEERLRDILNSENRVTSVWIYFPKTNEVISTRNGVYQLKDYDALNWLKQLDPEEKLRTWIFSDSSTERRSGGLIDLNNGSEGGNVTFVRSIPLTDQSDFPIIIGVGYLEFTLKDILGEVARQTKTSLYLYDDRGKVLEETGMWDQEKGPPFQGMPVIGSGGDGAAPYSILNNRWLFSESESKLTDWRLVSAAPLDNYMHDFKVLNFITFAFAFSALLFAALVMRSLMNGIHTPIRNLIAAMKKMEFGDLSVRLVYTKDDEFLRLTNGFNRMIETQETLIRTVYQERIAKQQAEMNFLTSQINPHFLYNTLGALYSMARRVDDNLAKSLLAISRMFRLSLNSGKEMVSVRDSVELITCYVQLMEIRNPGKYRLETYVEPNAEDQRIPTLLIQPIVENAVKHGLEVLPRNGTIRLSITLLSKSILIMISDNGIGLQGEELFRLRHILKNGPEAEQAGNLQPDSEPGDWSKGSGYALGNIYQRLKLKYGNDFTFHIESEWQKGTTVSVKIPREDQHEIADSR